MQACDPPPPPKKNIIQNHTKLVKLVSANLWYNEIYESISHWFVKNSLAMFMKILQITCNLDPLEGLYIDIQALPDIQFHLYLLPNKILIKLNVNLWKC